MKGEIEAIFSLSTGRAGESVPRRWYPFIRGISYLSLTSVESYDMLAIKDRRG
jgi:hypothetical protein